MNNKEIFDKLSTGINDLKDKTEGLVDNKEIKDLVEEAKDKFEDVKDKVEDLTKKATDTKVNAEEIKKVSKDVTDKAMLKAEELKGNVSSAIKDLKNKL
ncbi:MAG: hypothetical protein GX675_02825 [Erysipelotrichaceae bacterium]|nr:hypothetical protein [Erysipelotrichaceae bacterium]